MGAFSGRSSGLGDSYSRTGSVDSFTIRLHLCFFSPASNPSKRQAARLHLRSCLWVHFFRTKFAIPAAGLLVVSLLPSAQVIHRRLGASSYGNQAASVSRILAPSSG